MDEPRQTLLDELKFDIDSDNLRVRAGQLQARMQMYPVVVGSEALLALLFVWLMWNLTPSPGRWLVAWVAGLYVLHGFEMFTWWRYRHQLGSIEECRRWRWRFNFFTAAVGLVWGSTSLWLQMPDLVHQVLQICVMLGLAAGAVTMNPVYPPSLYIFVLSILVPLVYRIAEEGGQTHWALTTMLLLYLGTILKAGRDLAHTFWTSLHQRYENQSLVEQLTEQQALAERARQQAETASREKSSFLAAASHDLRQPLQALALFSEALNDRAREPEIQRLAGQIDSSIQALVGMFDELLNVSRLDAGVVEPCWQDFELQPLLDRLYVDFALLAQEKGLDFDIPVKIDARDCGAVRERLVVHSDPVLLERILRNLLSNAIRYTENGRVQLQCNCESRRLRFEVVDTGCGIKAEDVSRIFEEYYQANNPNRDRRKGLGLGLAIVRRMQKLLGYQMEVFSEPGRGSVFAFTVDLGEVEQLSHPFVPDRSGRDMRDVMKVLMEADPDMNQIVSALTSPFMAAQSERDLHDIVVVLLEDDPDIRQIISALMEEWGCQVLAGELAEQVMAQGRQPNLLVCDYRLPQGVTATLAIKQMREFWGAEIPAIVLTGDTAPEMLHEIYASGALLLHKPIAPARLRSFMHLALHGEN